jgi:hypothetical protein
MLHKVPLIRLLTAVAVALIACAFVSQYNWVANITRDPGASHPFYTSLVWRYSSYAYALPVLGLLFGVFFLRRSGGESVGLECTISFAWMATLLWILFALWAWELPLIQLHN